MRNFPIIGNSFSCPFAAFIMPITHNTKKPIDKNPNMLTKKYNLHDIARIMVLNTLYATP